MDSSVSIYTPTIQGIPWPKRIKVRPKIQRAFDAWYRINLDRFIIQFEFIRRTDTFLHLAFQVVTRVIEVELSNGELNVHVSWNEIWWDMLLWLETYPKGVPGGYVCAKCNPSTQETFSSREALWEIELFEAFLEWVNESLALAQTLHLYGDQGMTSARLVKEPAAGRFKDP